MALKIAINGFGRIGRCVLRAVFENKVNDMEIVAVNDLSTPEMLAHLLRFDSVHGVFNHEVEVQEGGFAVDGKFIRVTKERDPQNLPWDDVDIAFECTGIFKSKEKAGLILKSGAKRVLISAPGKDIDKTVVYGVNHDIIDADDLMVSNASCTTNCLAPVAHVLDKEFGIETGYMTTVHAYTGSQPTHDRDIKDDPYRSRAGTLSMIPTTTGATKALSLVLPQLEGKLSGSAIRVPTPNVSLVDMKVMTSKPASVEAVNAAIKAAADGPLKGVLSFEELPKVSIDFNHNPHSSCFAAEQTTVTDGGMLRILTWYDNEWGFSNRMLDTARVMGKFL